MNKKMKKQEFILVGCEPPTCGPYPSMHWAGGVSQHELGRVCVSQHALGMGVSAWGVVCPGGVCPGGYLPWGWCLPKGGCLPMGVSAQGVSAQGNICPGGVADPHPLKQNDKTGVKHYLATTSLRAVISLVLLECICVRM